MINITAQVTETKPVIASTQIDPNNPAYQQVLNAIQAYATTITGQIDWESLQVVVTAQ